MYLKQKPRPLYLALAHIIANAKPLRDAAKLERAQRLYMSLNPFQQMSCRIEIDAIRRARRGQRLAQVS